MCHEADAGNIEERIDAYDRGADYELTETVYGKSARGSRVNPRGDAAARGHHIRVNSPEGDLAKDMGVQIDQSGSDVAAGGVVELGRTSGGDFFVDGRNTTPDDRKIRLSMHSRSRVDHGPVLDHQIEAHAFPPRKRAVRPPARGSRPAERNDARHICREFERRDGQTYARRNRQIGRPARTRRVSRAEFESRNGRMSGTPLVCCPADRTRGRPPRGLSAGP